MLGGLCCGIMENAILFLAKWYLPDSSSTDFEKLKQSGKILIA